jgi:dynein heavy chain
MDDLSMPEANDWGDQPTLELVRQLVETKGCCFLDKDKRGDLKIMEDIQYMGAMGHPGGGRNDIPNRLKRHFFIFNMILPSSQAINEIYGQMMGGRYKGVTGNFLNVISELPNQSINLWNWVRMKMLPSPTKFHYTFSLRELSRVFQGVLRTPRESVPTVRSLVLLWRHECERVFCDKLTNLEEKDMFIAELNATTATLITASTGPSHAPASRAGDSKGGKFKKGAKEKKAAAGSIDQELNIEDIQNSSTLCVDFMRDDEYDEDGVLVMEAPKIYEIVPNLETARLRALTFLEKYNEQFPSKQLHIILFDDAMKHLLRISRVLGMSKGCILLVGVGGSGKQSLTRIASYCAGCTTFQITITKTYNMNALLDDIRLLYKACGSKGEKMTFLFTEAEIKDESFMEVINSILTTGEVPNLIPKDELIIMASELRTLAIKAVPNFVENTDNLVKYFIDRVRSNLHVVLCMSPVSKKLPERARRFPGIVYSI